jgi:RNA polymerase sigma factor (sigma-70 family)
MQDSAGEPPAGDERAWILAAAQGDHQAFSALVQRYQHAALRVALALTGDRGLAEDVVQEAFLTAYTELRRFDADRRFLPWLLGITVHRAQTARRSRVRLLRREWSLDPRHWLFRSAPDPQPLDCVLEDDQTRDLWTAIARLQPKLRQVIVLHYFAGLSVEAMASALDCSGGTVKSRLHYARRALAAVFPNAHPDALNDVGVTGAPQHATPQAEKRQGGATHGITTR